MAKINEDQITGFLIKAILLCLSVVVIYPFYYTVMVSFSSYQDLENSLLFIVPEKADFSSYKAIFELTGVARGLMVSTLITFIGTAVNLGVSVTAAYALSKKTLPGRSVFIFMILFTMLFEGGLVPYYLTIKSYGLINNLLVLVLPVAVNTFYLIILMNYFRSVPVSLEESARLDGANDILIFFRIIIPVSVPTLVAIGLFYAVDRWNEWWHAMLFVIDEDKFPLQLILRNMLVSVEQMIGDNGGAGIIDRFASIFTPGLKMASVVVSTIPIMMVYPYLQKYFTKGIMIGSIKG